MKFHLGKASLPLVEQAQPSQADTRYSVIMVENVDNVVQTGKVVAPEDWGTTEGESSQPGARRQLLFLVMLQRHRQQLSDSCNKVDDVNTKSNYIDNIDYEGLPAPSE